MGGWSVVFESAASKEVRRIERRERERILRAVEALKTDPRPAGGKYLKGRWSLYLRIRVGDYRVVCAVEDARLVVVVIHVGHRRDVYD